MYRVTNKGVVGVSGGKSSMLRLLGSSEIKDFAPPSARYKRYVYTLANSGAVPAKTALT